MDKGLLSSIPRLMFALGFGALALAGLTRPAAAQVDGCICSLPAPVGPGTAAVIGIINSIAGSVWFSGPNGPVPAESLSPISIGILPLTTGANSSVLASFGDSCDISVSQFSDLNVTPVLNQESDEPEIDFLCVFVARSEIPPVDAIAPGSNAGWMTLPISAAAAGVVGYFAIRNENQVSD